MHKRMLKVLLALVLAVLVLPVKANAQEAASGTCGENLTWTITEDGVLTLSGTGDMTDSLHPGQQIKHLVVGEGITSLTEGAFENEKTLETVQLPQSLGGIGNNAFAGCTGLKEVNLPDGLLEIGDSAFENCSALKEITVPAKVSGLGSNVFYGCASLEKVSLPNGLTGIAAGAFQHCTSLKEITIPASVTEMSNLAFIGCSNLAAMKIESGSYNFRNGADGLVLSADGTQLIWAPKSLSGRYTIPAGITTIAEAAFADCTKLTEVVVPEGVSKIESIAFSNCTALKKISLPESLTGALFGTFSGCSSLEEIVIPNGVTQIAGTLFSGCTGLKKVTIGAGVTSMDTLLFYDCKSLEKLTVDPGNTVFYSDTQNGLYSREDHSLMVVIGKAKTFTIPEGIKNITPYAFSECDTLEEVKLPKSLTIIGESAFNSCEGLKKITLHEGITALGEAAFMECTSLETIKLPESLSSVGAGAFWGCTSLKEITFPAEVAAIGSEAFVNCEALTKITFQGPTVVENRAFDQVNQLTTVVCGDAVPFGDWYPWTCAADVYYPADSQSWTPDVVNAWREYPWVNAMIAYEACPPHSGQWVVVSEADCTREGVRTRTCPICGKQDKEVTPALGHVMENRTCTRCGVTHRFYRAAGDNRFLTAFAVADALKETLGVEKFDTVILASGTNFADALSGSYLAAVKNAPILLCCNDVFSQANIEKFNNQTLDYVFANLAEGGTVYILGGEKAIPASIDETLNAASYKVERLAGATRFDTNLAILEEAGTEGKDILVCSGLGFADSLSASAAKQPILLVHNQSGLTQKQQEFLFGCTGKVYVIGGTSAVSTEIEAQLKEPTRLGGNTRFETSVLVAKQFFQNPESAVLAYALNFPDGLCGGVLAAAMDAPLILTMTDQEAAAAAYAKENGIELGYVLGSGTLISDNCANTIFGAEK